MKLNRIITACIVLMIAAGGAAAADESVWMTDFEQARKLAAEKQLPMLAYFSGSDWCSWCKRLDSEVLSKEVFKDHASKNFILFLADFPSKKKLDADVVRQNDALQKRYDVQGFPTLLVLGADGKVIARTGYRRGGAEAYVRHLKEIRSKP